MVLVVLFFSILIGSIEQGFCSKEAINSVSNSGELDFDLYFGPNSPEFETDFENNITFQDDVNKSNLLNQKLQPEIFELNSFLQGEFTQAVYCPNEQFLKNYDYIYT